MNKELLLQFVIKYVDEHYQSYMERARPNEDDKYELGRLENNNLYNELEFVLRKQPPEAIQNLPSAEPELLPYCKKHFSKNLLIFSFIMNYFYPEKYIFVHPSQADEAIMTGILYFSDIIPEFGDLPFKKLKKNAIDDYLILTSRLKKWAKRLWPNERDVYVLNFKIGCFLYWSLTSLFSTPRDYNQYWLIATAEEYFESLDETISNTWSGNLNMKVGDLVFVYRMSPTKAITDIFKITSAPRIDPWFKWGVYIDFERISYIPPISFSTLRDDPVMKTWGIVRRCFQGTTAVVLPHQKYNRLLSMIPAEITTKFNLYPEPEAKSGVFGEFSKEEEFDEKFISKLLKNWGFKYKTQKEVRMPIGSQTHHLRVDFFVENEKGPVTIFEDKLNIPNEKSLKKAADQGRSYALLMELQSYVIASPEGIWLYKTCDKDFSPIATLLPNEISDESAKKSFKQNILKLQKI